MKKRIIAKFIGKNNSCGFLYGAYYALYIVHKPPDNIKIMEITLTKSCEYSSIISFLNNWDDISNKGE